MSEHPPLSEQVGGDDDAPLHELAKASAEQKLTRMKAFVQNYPDQELAMCNQHLLTLGIETMWQGLGILSVSDIGYGALKLSLDVAPAHSVVYNATCKPDWDLTLFTTRVSGYLYISPSALNGPCNFALRSVGGIGEFALDLFYPDFTHIGNFFGRNVSPFNISQIGRGMIAYN